MPFMDYRWGACHSCRASSYPQSDRPSSTDSPHPQGPWSGPCADLDRGSRDDKGESAVGSLCLGGFGMSRGSDLKRELQY